MECQGVFVCVSANHLSERIDGRWEWSDNTILKLLEMRSTKSCSSNRSSRGSLVVSTVW